MHRKDRLFYLKKIIFDCYNLFKNSQQSVFSGQQSVFSIQYSEVSIQSLTTAF